MNATKSNQYGAIVHEIGTHTGDAKAYADRRLAASFELSATIDGGAKRDIIELGHGATLEFLPWGTGWSTP